MPSDRNPKLFLSQVGSLDSKITSAYIAGRFSHEEMRYY